VPLGKTIFADRWRLAATCSQKSTRRNPSHTHIFHQQSIQYYRITAWTVACLGVLCLGNASEQFLKNY